MGSGPSTLPGMSAPNGTVPRFGNAPAGTPLGNMQLRNGVNFNTSPGGAVNGSFNNPGMGSGNLGGANTGGVGNGGGSVVGGFQSGGFQGFQNGAFEMGGFNRGNSNAGASYPSPTVYGTTGPNFFPNNYAPGSYNAVYGNNPAPNVSGGYNPAPAIGNEQSAAEGRFQYGWW